MDCSDEDIIKKLNSTWDIQFFEILMNRYKNRIYNFVLKYLSSAEDSEDITQDIFVKVYFKLSSFNPDKGSFSTWIFTISRRTTINKLKERKMYNLTYELEEVNNTESQVENKELLYLGLKNIGDKYKKVLTMYYIEGFKYGEISNLLDISINTVKTRIRRAKDLLKNEIKDYV